MPRIFDNIKQRLRPALAEAMGVAHRADFCVGYFNLRGWRSIDDHVNGWAGGPGHCCRILVGMQRLPHEELRVASALSPDRPELDNHTALRLKKGLAEEFREQLTFGAPTNQHEAGLRKLARQIRARKVVVRLFLRHPLHAKLYLLFRSDLISPTVAYLGSSNLTQSGLSLQGELNVDVLDQDACQKLAAWFEDRWNDRWCVDISDELATIIEESWARERLIPPHHIYVKIAYHLSQEARAGLTEFRIPRDFGNQLLDFQTAAVKIAAHHLNKRGGVLIGDVVGLGKTLMATALARVFEDDHGLETLIICPRNLVPMWEDHRERYRMRARVLSMSRVLADLPDLRRYRLVLIDESHNLRNRQGKRYRAIQEYIRENESRCILLSATPYNKTYLDLSSQLRLFVPEAEDLGVRPERLLREMGETEFMRRHQAPVRSLAAFEQSPYADDWRELMRLYLVHRTRSFVQENYAATDPTDGRRYLTFEDGERSYFPTRAPKTLRFDIDVQYARLFADDVVDAIAALELPRYGLGNYVAESPPTPPTPVEAKVLDDLSRAGKRLMGFCRTNLFKRLESSGHAFLLSVERHALRNFVFMHAIEHGLPLPIGTADASLLDAQSSDEDAETAVPDLFDTDAEQPRPTESASLRTEEDFRRRAGEVYAAFRNAYRRRFRWLSPHHLRAALGEDLTADAAILRSLLARFGEWRPAADAKLGALQALLLDRHPDRKVLVFTQFADTVRYLDRELRSCGVAQMAAVTGDTPDPTGLAWRFSPRSNGRANGVASEEELRILVATDVLSEGQNLQDCAVVVNYDLPWAIIRLIQRAGRVDRIGQRARDILCYSFLPAEGIERLLRLRARVRERLDENAEVVGADEAFFEGDDEQTVLFEKYINQKQMGAYYTKEDITMEEAVEICKLRLFLKLVAQLERYDQIEPLPDIDFNVRTGNTLVGFASLAEVKRALGSDLIKKLSLPDIEERAEVADRAFGKFRTMQTEHGMDAGAFADAKAELRRRLDDLRDELNGYLAREYGVTSKAAVHRWRASHQPFHWFVEFYGVMHRGGFDVIIGNPPYVEYSKVRKEYRVQDLSTMQCGNLYPLCTERSLDLLASNRWFGFIPCLTLVHTWMRGTGGDGPENQGVAVVIARYRLEYHRYM